MAPYDILMLLCLIGGAVGVVIGAARRDVGVALLGLVVFVLALGALR